MDEFFDLGEVPFFWRIKKRLDQEPSDIPTRLPFCFGFAEDLQLVIQRRNNTVLEWLERVYREDANVGYLQDGHALAASYGGEFLEFFTRSLGLLSKPPASAADIGCGGVYLLQKVREQGIAVKGIDPSPVTAVAGKRAGIEIVSDFYPSPLLTEQFDVLFHYDVLEHVEDPVAFLRAHHANLSSHGALIFAVPDCSQHIALGDVSMFLHEHLNYFDSESLAHVVRAAGFEPLLLEPARHGGVLFCCAVPATSCSRPHEPVKDKSKFEAFRAKAQSAMQRFATLAGELDGGELGIYVPLRAFPYLARIPSGTRMRFFDDDPGLRGRYYDAFDIAIEDSHELAIRPPGLVVICSLAFGHQIAARLQDKLVGKLRIVMWTDFFGEVAG
jgi:2-polyprenyl-3-methyl-5-hydroxy-6-metoxy-1,4-benzoquinol methylase